MPIGKIERWDEYIGVAAGLQTVTDEANSLDALMPPVYFHIDPEELNVDYGYKWSADAKGGGGNQFVVEDEDVADPTDLAIPHKQKANTGVIISGLNLRFDDFIGPPPGGLSTEDSIKALHNMACPFDDIRDTLQIFKKYKKTATATIVFILQEAKKVLKSPSVSAGTYTVPGSTATPSSITRSSETGEIDDKGKVRYWVKQADRYDHYYNDNKKILISTNTKLVHVEGKLAPHPLVLNLGWPMSNFVCVITKMKYNITRMDLGGMVKAATVTLTLEEYDRQTLRAATEISDSEIDDQTENPIINTLYFVRDEDGNQRRVDIPEDQITFDSVGAIVRR